MEQEKGKKTDKKEKHFVLIHGAGHGAWCWFEVATMLKWAGHKVTALDMTASGINPKKEREIHSFSDYNEPLIQFMASLPSEEKINLLGHSLGGVNITVAMEDFSQKISVAVFATAFMLSENLTYPDINAAVTYFGEIFVYSKHNIYIYISLESYNNVGLQRRCVYDKVGDPVSLCQNEAHLTVSTLLPLQEI